MCLCLKCVVSSGSESFLYACSESTITLPHSLLLASILCLMCLCLVMHLVIELIPMECMCWLLQSRVFKFSFTQGILC